jgi:hypothetical protein
VLKIDLHHEYKDIYKVEEVYKVMNADGTPDDGAQDDINNANNDQE